MSETEVTKKRGRGRPRTADTVRDDVYTIRLTPEVAEYLKANIGGTVSTAVQNLGMVLMTNKLGEILTEEARSIDPSKVNVTQAYQPGSNAEAEDPEDEHDKKE